MAKVIQDKGDLVEAIVGMPFGELMQVAHELVSMVAESDVKRKINTPSGMAEMLYDWAEAQDDHQ